MVKILVDHDCRSDYLEWEIKQNDSYQISNKIFDYLYSHGIDVEKNNEKLKKIDFSRIHNKITRLIKLTETFKTFSETKPILIDNNDDIHDLKGKPLNSLLQLQNSKNDDDSSLFLLENEEKINQMREVYHYCCNWRGIKVLDKRGLMLLFENLNIILSESELALFVNELHVDCFTFDELLNIFGSSWFLFHGEIKIPKLQQNSIHDNSSKQPLEISKQLSLPDDSNSSESQENDNNNNSNIESLSEQLIKAQSMAILPISSNILQEKQQKRKKATRLRSSANSSVFVPNQSDSNELKSLKLPSTPSSGKRKSKLSIRTSKRRVSRSETEPPDTRNSIHHIKSPREIHVENESQNIIRDIKKEKFSRKDNNKEQITTLEQQEYLDSHAYHLFSNIYKTILSNENSILMNADLITKYFKDASCTLLLSQQIIPTIMQQSSNK